MFALFFIIVLCFFDAKIDNKIKIHTHDLSVQNVVQCTELKNNEKQILDKNKVSLFKQE